MCSIPLETRIKVLFKLQQVFIHGTGSVLCVGSEWHRFPSSFLVPDYVREVRWIDDGFRGLLPFPFNSTLGGTSAAPPYFNNKNQASDQQYVIHSSLLLVSLRNFGISISFILQLSVT